MPILPVLDDAGEWPKAHIKRGRPAGVWIYRDAAGKPLGAVYRFTTSDGGKEVLPCCYAEHRESAAREWRWLAFPEPRPLYGPDLLAAKPDAPVLVVEGEKCADAARAYLGDALAIVTWPGGCKAAYKADWLPLRRRKVILWPDCDAQTGKDGELLPEAAQPGIRAMERIALALAKLDCQVRIVAIPAPGAKPSGWDIVDAIAEGWSAEQLLRSFIKDHLRPPAFAAAANRERVEIDESTASDRRHNLEAELRADPELMAALGELADQPSEDGVASLFVNHVGLPRLSVRRELESLARLGRPPLGARHDVVRLRCDSPHRRVEGARLEVRTGQQRAPPSWPASSAWCATISALLWCRSNSTPTRGC